MNDLRYALRQLIRSPGFTFAVVLSLGLGIGANAAVFTWIEHLLLRPLPGVARQEQLVVLTTSHGEKMWDTVSLPDIRDIAGLSDIFSGVSGSQQTPACITINRQSEWLYGQIVTANFFDVLGVKPLLGRTFLPEEDLKPGGHPVLVISENVWRRRFGSDPNILGRVVELNRHAFTIVGVAPGEFFGDTAGLRCDFWAPTMMHHEVAYSGIEPNQILRRYARWHHTYGRLQPGVTIAQARAALATLSIRLEQTYPDTNRDIRFHAWTLAKSTYGAPAIFRPMLALLVAVSLGVLLIVSANIANLLLARATSRQSEFAIRLAVGANRSHIVKQLLTESMVLAVIGGGAGILAAYWMVDLLKFFIPRTPLPVAMVETIDARILGATLVLTLGAGLVFGLFPALQASKPKLNESLKESGRSQASSAAHHRARGVLVVVEISLALVLLVAAGLCVRGLRQSKHIDPGFDSHGVLLAGLRVGMNGYTRDTAPAFYRTLRQRLAEMPDVQAVGLANWFPLGFEDTGTNNVEITGQEQRAGQPLNFRVAIVSPGYFAALHIPFVAGRDFDDRDDLKARRVVIINETMAKRFWPGEEAVGRVFKNNGADVTVVGVAKAGKYRLLNEPPESFFYLPSTQAPWQLDLSLCLRARNRDPATLIDEVRREIHAIDPNVHVWQSLPLADYVEAAVMPQRMASTLMMVLSAVALALAAMGVYAVMAYSVNQRRREIGIRMALGATPGNVLWHVSRMGLTLTLTGILIGFGVSIWSTGLLARFLYGVSRFDAATFTVVPLLLAAIAFLACYIPARRATRVDPVETLRSE